MRRRAVVGLAFMALGTTDLCLAQAPAAGLQFLTVAPCRVMDTRNANGPLGGPFIAGGTTRTIPIPLSACGIPANASAYSLNLTVVPRIGTLSYLSVWPAGQPQPLVSTLNSPDGSVLANAAIVPAGTAGAIDAYAPNDTDLIVDINGYFAPPAGNTLQFYPLAPCRVLDTRNAIGTFGGPSIGGTSSRSFPIPASSCGAPAFAAAYAFNLTVVPYGGLGYLTAWPTGQALPNVSTLNSFDGTTLANAAIVPAGTGGAVSFYAADTTDLVVDINGYFASPGDGGLNFFPVTPCRLVDTRNAVGVLGGPTMTGDSARAFPLSQGSCGLPAVSSPEAYSLNMTVVPHGVLNYITTWPTGGTQPGVSTLNAFKGLTVANAAIVPAGTGGSIDVYVTNTTDVVIDTNGYFGLGFASGTPQIDSLTISSNSVVGGSPVTGSVTLSAPAPAGGAVVALSSSSNAAFVPASITVQAGAYSATFSMTTVSVSFSEAVTITAAYGGASVQASFSVTAAAGSQIQSLTLLSSSVTGGGSDTGTVVLSAAAPAGGANVALSSNSNAASVPATVSVPAGSTSATFNVNTVSVSSNEAVTITASYGGASATAGLTVTVPTGLAITSLSNSSPLPFSPLAINTTGINPSNPVDVTFTDNAGYTVTTPAVTVTAAGGVMVATPLYVNTSTGQIGPAALSVTVSQGSATSSEVSLNVQDIPPLSTYGTSLGQISHAVLVFDALLIGQQLNQLQAYQLLPGNTIDTTGAQATLNTILNAVIQARSDVDNVMLNNSYVVQNGTQPDGTSIQFDQNSLDMMDRINALFLNQTFATLPSSYISAARATSPQSPAILLLPTRKSGQDDSEEKPDASNSTIKSLVDSMEATLGVKDLVTGYQQTQSNCVSPCVPWIQQVQGNAQVMSGINGLLDGVGAVPDATKTISQNIGVVGALLQNIQVVGNVAAQLTAFTVGEVTGNQALVNVAVQAMDEGQGEAIKAGLDLTFALFGGPGFSEGVQQVATTLSFAKTLYDLGQPAQEQANATPGEIATEVQSMPNVSMEFGTLDGMTIINNSAGIAAAPTGLDLSSGCLEITTVADPSGNYQIVVPLNVPGFDYGDADLEAYDPVTNGYISDETVNIDSLSPTNSLTLPTLAGSCDDTDSTDPDSDDPDCDLRKPQSNSSSAHLLKLSGSASRAPR
jgi:hypothetical protein